MNNKIIYLFVLITLSGCTKEDLSMCFDNPAIFRIDFLFSDNSQETTLPFNRSEIYIFDKDDLYVTKYSIETENYDLPNRGLEFESELPIGSYKAIGWAYRMRDANSHIPYIMNSSEFVIGQTSLSDIYINMSSATRSHTTGVLSGIYNSGITEFKIISNEVVYVDIEYMRLTKDIDINIKFVNSDGSPNLDSAQGAQASINCWDGVLNFDGSVIGNHDDISYRPYVVSLPSDGMLNKKYRKMTLAKSTTEPIIEIVEDGVSLYSERLFILLEGTNYPTQESLNMTNHYKIDIEIGVVTDDQYKVNIWINGWKYIPINEGV